jgi:MFS family permease
VLFMGNNLPSALYGVFRAALRYSALTQTLLYAVPIVTIVLPGLLIFGPLSDLLGRRALVLGGVAAFAAGDVVFAAAGSTATVYLARLLQGLGIASATAAAGAALSDSAGGFGGDAARSQRLAAITSTVCITGGLALGPLVGGVLAQYAGDPRRIPFYVHLALLALAGVAASSIPGAPAAERVRWRLARLEIPPSLRPSFTPIAVTGFLAWAVLGVFSAVIPTLMAQILRTTNLALTAGSLSLMIATSAATQLCAQRVSPRRGEWSGLVALTAGLGALIVAETAHDAVWAVTAMLGCGVGHGLVFASGLKHVTVLTPVRERGSVLGVVYFINYLGLGVPVIGVGLLSSSIGLLSATRIAAIAIATSCLLVLVTLRPEDVSLAASPRPPIGPPTDPEPPCKELSP